MWRRLWNRIKPFNINSDDEQAIKIRFEEIMHANGIKHDRVWFYGGPVPVISPSWPSSALRREDRP